MRKMVEEYYWAVFLQSDEDVRWLLRRTADAGSQRRTRGEASKGVHTSGGAWMNRDAFGRPGMCRLPEGGLAGPPLV